MPVKALALEDGTYAANLLRDLPSNATVAPLERHRKARTEKVVADGRRRGDEKAIVNPVCSMPIREWAIRLIVPLFQQTWRSLAVRARNRLEEYGLMTLPE
jgi:hypothetical protein